MSVENGSGAPTAGKQMPAYQVHSGYNFPPIFKEDNIKSALTYQPKPGNIFICTYPRSGTTWMQNIIYLMLHNGEPLDVNHTIDEHVPYLEKVGAEVAAKAPAPGLAKTHLRGDLLPVHPEAKYIYILRNPKDQVISYYEHATSQKTQGFNGDFSDYFQCYMDGALPYGDYFDHMLSFLPHIEKPNFLLLTYEELMADIRQGIIKVGHFLGGECAKAVDDRSILEAIIRNQEFKAMKAGAARWRSPRSAAKAESFLGRPIVGDWKDHLTDEQSQRLDEKYAQKTRGTPHEHLFDGVM